jgi:radical SAM superfamily enzyme YgiQ (UPF0313 family)
MKQVRTVYLVNAGNDAGISAIANDHSFPALGILTLGTWLQNSFSDIHIVARDGGVISSERINQEIGELRPDVVGISVLSTSYQNGLATAQAANGVGAKVVLGNDHAAQLSRRILEKRPYVDFVIGSEYGEKSLELLIRALRGEDIPLGAIPHLTYRQHGQVCSPDSGTGNLSIIGPSAYGDLRRTRALDIFPVPDRTLYPEEHWKSYLSNYLAKFSGLHLDEAVIGVATMNRARGCSRANDETKCKFCDMFLDPAFSSPKLFWTDVREAHRQVGANVFYEVCDSLSSFPEFVHGLVQERPRDLGFDPKFFVYAQAVELVRNPDLVKVMKELGVFRVNIGLESGSDDTLKHMKGRDDSVEKNERVVRLLRENQVYLYGSLVLGSDAETPASLCQTVAWAKKIIREGLIADIEAQPVLPLPNNFYGRKFRHSGLLTAEESQSDWPWDIDSIAQRYIDRFSGVTYQDTLHAAWEIRECAKEHRINFGSGVSRKNNYR